MEMVAIKETPTIIDRDQVESLPTHPLARWRESSGVVQSELARKIGVSVAYICKIERWNMPTTSPGKAAALEGVTGIPRYTFLYPEYYWS
jgi:transcriptional regulator with XRE-family HTH domain